MTCVRSWMLLLLSSGIGCAPTTHLFTDQEMTSPKIGCPVEDISVPYSHSEIRGGQGFKTWTAVCHETTYECTASASDASETHTRVHRSGRVDEWKTDDGVLALDDIVCTKK